MDYSIEAEVAQAQLIDNKQVNLSVAVNTNTGETRLAAGYAYSPPPHWITDTPSNGWQFVSELIYQDKNSIYET